LRLKSVNYFCILDKLVGFSAHFAWLL